MATFQELTLVANLGQDPEKISFNNNGFKALLNVATEESWKDRQTGQWVSRTEWHRVHFYNKATAEYVLKNYVKGQTVLIKAKLQTRKWQNAEGKDQYTTEIHATSTQPITSNGRNRNEGNAYQNQQSNGQAGYQSENPNEQKEPVNNPPPGMGGDMDDFDKIPF